jgi:protein-tyrosine sulfotransferase
MDVNNIQPHSNANGVTQACVPICARPVFVIGSPRSGTTILAWSLAQHSQFWTSDESQILWDLFEGGRLEKNYQRLGRYDGSWLCKQNISKEEFLAYLGLGLNALFTSRSQGKRWIDQTPVYALLADHLARMFPGGLFIHILRDGRKVVHSMINFLTRFREQGLPEVIKKSPKPAWSADFQEACRTWRRFVEAALDFQAACPGRCLTVLYDQLVSDPAKEFAEILQFLQVPCEDAPANYFRSNRINSSFVEPPGPRSATERSSDPWRSWTREQRRIFLEEAGPTMLKYGLATEQELTVEEDAIAASGTEAQR